MGRYLIEVLVAIDQLVNTIFGGDPRETISAVCYRRRNEEKAFKKGMIFINHLFFWQKNEMGQRNHCERAFNKLKNRGGMPKEYRQ